jgi:hypothetical protein
MSRMFERRRPRRGAPRRAASVDEYPYVWDRDKLPSGRKGTPCKKVQPRQGARPNGMVTVEFTDGARFIVHPQGLRKR